MATPTPREFKESLENKNEVEKPSEDTTFIRRLNGDIVTTEDYAKDPD